VTAIAGTGQLDAGLLGAMINAVTGKLLLSVLTAALLGAATVRLPASPCMLMNTPSEKACQSGCCANKTCCETSHQRTSSPAEPLAKSSPTYQLAAIVAPVIQVFLPSKDLPRPRTVVLSRQSVGHSPARLAFLCSFLI
jgi:hypothetical protein